MKKYCFYIILSLISCPFSTVSAQQMGQFTNYIFNYQSINPAATGYTQCTEFKSSHRRQWFGIKGAPVTTNAMIHARMRPSKNNFQGIGAQIESDQVGAFGLTGLTVNYAYHTKLTKGYNLSAGVGVGFMQFRLDHTKLSFLNPAETAITNSVSDLILPNINMGFWLYRGDRFIGLSIRSITSPKIEGTMDSRLNRSYNITGGKYIKVNKAIAFKPSFMFKWVKSSRPALDAQLMLSYKKAFSFGIAARNGHGFSALLRVEMLNQITVWYAYDLTMNKLKYGSMSTHELCIGIKTCEVLGKSEELCAAYD
jgi:type IX secretion system PorP/SprF family membrane protein